MAGTGRYCSIEDLQKLRRLEKDVDLPDMGWVFRIQALTQDQFSTIQQKSGIYGLGVGNNILATQLSVAYGLVSPDLHAESDEEAAMEIVRALPVPVLTEVGKAIMELTVTPPQDAYKSFFGGADSELAGEDTASTNGVSPARSASRTLVSLPKS